MTLRRKGLAVFAVPLAALLLSGLVFFILDITRQNASKQVRHTLEVRSSLRVLLIDLSDAETGVQSYLLSKNSSFLAPYNNARITVPTDLIRIGALIQDNPSQVERFEQLSPLVTARLEAMEDMQELGAFSNSLVSVIPTEQLFAGVSSNTEIRGIIDEMTAEEDRLLEVRTKNESNVRLWSRVALAATLFLGFTGGLLAMVGFTSGVVRRVERLAGSAQDLAKGERIAIDDPSTDEVGALGRSLVTAGELLISREEDLRKWGHIFEHSDWGVAVAMGNGDRYSMVNPAFARMHGYTLEQMVDMPVTAVFAPEAQDGLAEATRISRESGHYAFESVHIRADGTTFPVFIDVAVVRDDDGELAYRIANVQDITQRKEMEDRLAVEVELLNTLMDSLPDAVFIKDKQSKFLRVNRATAEFFGYETIEEAVGKSDFDYFSEEEARKYFEQEQHVMETGEPLINSFEEKVSADGAHMWSLTTKVPVRNATGAITGLVGIARDYTEMKQAEMAQSRLAAIIESAEDAIVGFTLDGVVTSWNPAAERLYRYGASEAIGQRLDTLVVPEEAQSEFDELLTQISNGERVEQLESTWATKNGGPIEISLTVSPVRSAEGVVVGAAAIGRDITARKQAEAALIAANRELEAFSFSVSHDLRAPLRIVDGFSRILVEDYEANLPDDAKRVLKIVRDGTIQMGQLIDDLLAFSRLGRQPLRVRPVYPDSIVHSVLDEMSADMEGRPIDLKVDELPACQADPALLKQVYVNLIGNALKYSRGKNPTIITIGALPSHEGALERTYFVKDNGVGFDMTYASKLFGVFQRLHRAEDYEGTGVGLALVQRIVHRHGGRIWAESMVDQGATFWFTLPAAEASESTVHELTAAD